MNLQYIYLLLHILLLYYLFYKTIPGSNVRINSKLIINISTSKIYMHKIGKR